MLSAFLNRERHDPSRCAWRHGCAMSTGGRKSSSSYRTAPAWNGKRGGLLTHTKQPELVLAHRSGSPTGRTPADEKVTAATSIKKTATPSFIFTFLLETVSGRDCQPRNATGRTAKVPRASVPIGRFERAFKAQMNSIESHAWSFDSDWHRANQTRIRYWLREVWQRRKRRHSC